MSLQLTLFIEIINHKILKKALILLVPIILLNLQFKE